MLRNRTARRSMSAILILLAIAGYVATPTETLATSGDVTPIRFACCVGVSCVPVPDHISVRLTIFQGNDQGRGLVQIGNVTRSADFVETTRLAEPLMEWKWKGGQVELRKATNWVFGWVGSYQIAGSKFPFDKNLRCMESRYVRGEAR